MLWFMAAILATMLAALVSYVWETRRMRRETERWAADLECKMNYPVGYTFKSVGFTVDDVRNAVDRLAEIMRKAVGRKRLTVDASARGRARRRARLKRRPARRPVFDGWILPPRTWMFKTGS